VLWLTAGTLLTAQTTEHKRRCRHVTESIRTWSQYRSSRKQSTDGLLLREEEFFLGRMVQSGTERDKAKATDELVTYNVRLVSGIAKKYKGRGCDHDDMMTDGMLGLHYAIQRYDASKGYRFSTYATNWIRQAIGRGVENRGREIRLPSHVIAKITHIRIARTQYTLKHGQSPSMPELLAWIHGRLDSFPKYLRRQLETLDVAYLADIIAMERATIKSLDEPTTTGMASGDLVASEERGPEYNIERETIFEQLYKVMEHLTPREMACIRLRFGFDGLADERSLEDVGLLVGYSRERIRQIQCRAVEKLRSTADAGVLLEILEGFDL
jgi:RNA polymerase primary sigma factor